MSATAGGRFDRVAHQLTRARLVLYLAGLVAIVLARGLGEPVRTPIVAVALAVMVCTYAAESYVGEGATGLQTTGSRVLFLAGLVGMGAGGYAVLTGNQVAGALFVAGGALVLRRSVAGEGR
ncbi:hypothetical protein [Haloarchaeobius sp. HME9146]|uniref:hypothetical protein n=1 Tax=Haloarchaeobius sp. HME9146 TaxID=2978732 RepID=UPI0021BEDE71|nr:hypothetical protein [Haloarchaeobius sp. HME9146]MCT9097816.1 hypothetical protein [Haloarchaeobius sp. HME9146]